MRPKQILAIAISALLIVNLILLAARKITPLYFWAIIGGGALVAMLQKKRNTESTQ